MTQPLYLITGGSGFLGINLCRALLARAHLFNDLIDLPDDRRNPRQLATYGWHRAIDRPIQPLSTIHGARYVDYSHGVRLIAPVAYVDGEARSLLEVLQDTQLASMLSDEGAIQHLVELLDMLKAPSRNL